MKLRVIGDSHVEALSMGLRLRQQRGLPAPNTLDISFCYLGNGFHLAEPFWERRDGSLRMLREDYAASLAQATGAGGMTAERGVMYGMCMGLHTARVFRDPMWKRFVPWTVAPSGGEAPVSSGTMDRIVDDDAKYIAGFLEAMKALAIPFFVVSAPPPYRGHACMTREGLRPEVVIAVDRAYRARMLARLDAMGVPCVVPPEDARDAAGFMHPKYRIGVVEHDPHHGNAEYGLRMMGKVLRCAIECRRQLSGPRSPPPDRPGRPAGGR